jgi:hypothetical protein
MAPALAPDEDELDTYRREVEQHLGAAFEALDDADIEAFFTHVIACFERRVGIADCARRWLATRSR